MTRPPIEIQADDLAVFHGQPSPATRRVWAEWMRRHSIDPMDVAVIGCMSRCEATRRVSYLAYERDPDTGKVLVRDGDVHRVVHTVQLEAVPAPFPEVTE